MVIRTFLDKCTTIFEDSEDNFGLNPVGMINAGLINSRVLVHFDVEKIREMHTQGAFPDAGKLTHVLKLTNSGSLYGKHFSDPLISNDKNGFKVRATSFDIIAFKVPKEWDRGVGFDASTDYFSVGDKAWSNQACNWFQSKNGVEWDEAGMISENELCKELDKYDRGEESLIVGRQHFPHGNENFSIDITGYVNDLVDNLESNKGLCICFSPYSFLDNDRLTKYVGFFTDKTNTFFQPVLETRYNDAIVDDRENFRLSKDNRLYLNVLVGGESKDCDSVPTCEVDGVSYPVTRQGVGIYYATVNLPKDKYEKDMILQDVWKNVVIDGEDYSPVENEFVTMAPNVLFMAPRGNNDDFVVASGINTEEKLVRGEKRKVELTFKRPYEGKRKIAPSNIKYRLYIMDGSREYDVIDWDLCDAAFEYVSFPVDTEQLLPNKYHVDVKADGKVYKDILRFTVVNNTTRQKL